MLIKLRFISLLFVFLLSTFTFAQNYQSMSLNELHEDLNYWQNVVDEQQWWFFKRYSKRPGSEHILIQPDFLPNVEGIKIWLRERYGKDDYLYVNSSFEPDFNYYRIAQDQMRNINDVKREVILALRDMLTYSNLLKKDIRERQIPEIEKAIRIHPDSIGTYKPEATHCHSIGSGSYMIGDKQSGNRCHYHANGQLHEETPYAHGVIHGTKRVYWDNGNKREEIPYWNGKRNGTMYSWWKNGNRLSIINYVDDSKHGEARTFFKNGNPSTCRIYNKGIRTHNCSL